MKYILSISLLLLTASSVFSEPVEWQELNIQLNESLWADSSLQESIGGKEVTYGPEALFDGDYSTPWVEGVEGSGAGESITILTRRKVTGLSIVNGFAVSEKLFRRNNRLKNFSVSFIAGLTAPGLISENDYYLYFTREQKFSTDFQIEDNMDKQDIPLYDTEELQSRFYSETVKLFAEDYPDLFTMILEDLGISLFDEISSMDLDLIMEIYGFFAVRITIRDVYAGTNYNDTCLSEIELAMEDF